jgi:hypothetical protein
MTGVALFDSSAVILASILCSVHNDKNVSAAELLYGTSISGIGKFAAFSLAGRRLLRGTGPSHPTPCRRRVF